MKITILGTAAAEGVPSLFCNCDVCRKSREAGGRNIRSRSSLLVDEILKIDFPPDTFYHSVKHHMDTARLKYLLITHSHHDHLAHMDLGYIRPGFAARNNLPNLQLYANKDVIETIECTEDMPLDCHTLLPFQAYNVGEYTVTTLKAMHGVDETPLNYIVEKTDRSFLYTCDTGYYDDETWTFLAGKKVDLVITECTGGPGRIEYKYHLGLENIRDLRKQADEIGLTGAETPWVLTHFTHNCGVTYDEMTAIAEPDGYQVGYDGMVIYL